MGVFGLYQYCCEHAESASQLVNLTELAAEHETAGKPALTLTADGSAFFHYIFPSTSTRWEWVLGGNYPEMARLLENWISRLRKAGVDLSVFLDPPRAKEEKTKNVFERKRRFKQRCSNIERVMQLLRDGEELEEWEDQEIRVDWQPPLLLHDQALRTLRKLGVMVMSCEQSADEELSSLLHRIPGWYAILSGDSDFFVLEDARFVPLEHLQFQGDQVFARVFTPASVAACLGISLQQLPDLAFLCGNDITCEFMDKHKIAQSLRIATVNSRSRGVRCSPEQVALFLAEQPEQRPLREHPVMLDLATKDVALQEALSENAAFYAHAGEVMDAEGEAEQLAMERSGRRPPAATVEELLERGIRDCTLPGWLLSVHKRRELFLGAKVEAKWAKESGMDLVTRPLRQVIYALVAPSTMQSGHAPPPIPTFRRHKSYPPSKRPPPSVSAYASAGQSSGHSAPMSASGEESKTQKGRGARRWRSSLEATPAEEGVDGGGRFVVVEHVREGGGRKQHGVAAVPGEVLEAAAGSGSVIELRRLPESDKRRVLPPTQNLVVCRGSLCKRFVAILVLVHLEGGETVEGSRLQAAAAKEDVLNALPVWHTIVMPGDGEGSSPTSRQVPLWGIGILLRYAVVLQATAKARGVGVVWSAWDFECMLRVVALLCSGTEVGHLSPFAPLARAAEVSSLFLSSVSVVSTLAQLLGAEAWLPEPADMFSGRVWAHLHSNTPSGAALAARVEGSPLRELVSTLRDAVLGVFGDAEELLGKLEVEGGFGRRRALALEVEILGLEQAEGGGAGREAGDALPISEHREKIIESVLNHHVVCIQGDTGSGKSSMVPQFVVEDARRRGVPVKVMVTQPRRIAAVTLARRVASQRGEAIGKSVGYRIGHGDHVDSGETVITFVTVGYALQLLSHNPARLNKYTHLILDEVHERTMEGDLLSLLMRKLMGKSACKTKLVVMSATLQQGLFGEYFTKEDHQPLPPIFVGSCRFPVQEIFLNELVGAIPGFSGGAAVREMERRFAKLVKKQDESGGVLSRLPAEFTSEAQTVMVNLVVHLAQPSSCILCFLPGIGEISSVQDDLEQADSKTPLQILVLHSLVPREEQEAAIVPAHPECCKVILSTNIAQTSVTIPDVRFVIDSGVHRSIFYDHQRRLQSLLCTWCSQATAKQRAGRAGRVAPGTMLYLFTREFHAKCMPKFDDPEMLRVSLDKTVLRVKLLLRRFGRTSDLLAEALSPPQPAQVLGAVRALYQAGALTREDEDGEVSQLGRLAVDLPVELALVKLILLARAFGCLNDGIVMAGALSVQDLFSMPSTVFMRDRSKYNKELLANTASRIDFDGGCCSEPLMLLTAYKQWLGSDRHQRWAKSKSLSFARLKQLDLLLSELAVKLQTVLDATGDDAALLVRLSRLHSACLHGNTMKRETLKDLFSNNLPLLRFLIAGAFAPTFLDCRVRGTAKSKTTKDSARPQALEAAAEEPEVFSGLHARYLVTLGKIPPKSNNEEVVLPALKAAGLPARSGGFKKLGVGEAVVALQAHAKDSPGSGDDKGRMGWGAEGKVVEDCCFLAKMARVLWTSNRRKLALPIPAGDAASKAKDGSGQLEIGRVCADSEVEFWVSGIAIHEGEETSRALPYWRAPIATLSDLSGCKDRWAVALSMLGTEHEVLVRVVGVTLFPEGLFAKVSQLIFCPRYQPLRVRANASTMRFDAVRIGKGTITLQPITLSVQDFGVINLARRFVSDAVAGVGTTSGVFSLQAVLAQLLPLLLRSPESSGAQRRRPGGAAGDQEGDDKGVAQEAATDAPQRQWIPCALEDSKDYLPQISLDFEAAQREYEEAASGRQNADQGKETSPGLTGDVVAAPTLPRRAAEKEKGKGNELENAGQIDEQGGAVLSVLVLRADEELMPRLPVGVVRVGGEPMREVAVSWVALSMVVDLDDLEQLKIRVGVLLQWFKTVLDNDVRALLVLSSVLNGETRRVLSLASARLSLSTRCVGSSTQRRLLVFTHRLAIKGLPVMGDVSVPSSGSFSVPVEAPGSSQASSGGRKIVLDAPGKGLFHVPLQPMVVNASARVQPGAAAPPEDATQIATSTGPRDSKHPKNATKEEQETADKQSVTHDVDSKTDVDKSSPTVAAQTPERLPPPQAPSAEVKTSVMTMVSSLLDMVAALQPAVTAILQAGPDHGMPTDAVPLAFQRRYGTEFPLSRFNASSPVQVSLEDLLKMLDGVEVAIGATATSVARLKRGRQQQRAALRPSSIPAFSSSSSSSRRAPPSPSALPLPSPSLLERSSNPPSPAHSSAHALSTSSPLPRSSTHLALTPPEAFAAPHHQLATASEPPAQIASSGTQQAQATSQTGAPQTLPKATAKSEAARSERGIEKPPAGVKAQAMGAAGGAAVTSQDGAGGQASSPEGEEKASVTGTAAGEGGGTAKRSAGRGKRRSVGSSQQKKLSAAAGKNSEGP